MCITLIEWYGGSCLTHLHDASKWKNILTLVELIFVFPLSNGCIERCISQLKVVNTIIEDIALRKID